MSTTCSLAQRECVPCRGGVPPLEGAARRTLLTELGGDWTLVEDRKLEKTFQLPDFATALALVNRIGEEAERQGHHPDLFLAWGKVRVVLWTHKIGGLSESDFILAARIDALTDH